MTFKNGKSCPDAITSEDPRFIKTAPQEVKDKFISDTSPVALEQALACAFFSEVPVLPADDIKTNDFQFNTSGLFVYMLGESEYLLSSEFESIYLAYMAEKQKAGNLESPLFLNDQNVLLSKIISESANRPILNSYHAHKLLKNGASFHQVVSYLQNIEHETAKHLP
jgi:hypothetical protein